MITDAKGQVIFWNQGAKEVFGYEEKEVFMKPVGTFFTDSSFLVPFLAMENHGNKVVTTRNYGREGEIEGIRKNREQFPCELTAVRYNEGVTKLMLVFVHDLSHGIMNFLKKVAKKLEIIDDRLNNLEEMISGTSPRL